MPVDRGSLPRDPDILLQMIVDLTRQLDNAQGWLDKTQRLLQQLLSARSGTRSEQLSADQLRLFAQELGLEPAAAAGPEEQGKPDKDGNDDTSGTTSRGENKPRGRQPLPRHLKRERIIYDLTAGDKHCADCDQDLRHMGEEVSERYEYLPAQMLVVEEACQKYACACKIRTASKPVQPIEKSTASASVLAQVIVSKIADHLPVHRQVKMLRRLGVELSDQTLCGWLRQSAELLEPLYECMKAFVLSSKVVGTDDTPVKVLDRALPHTRTGRLWPYVGDRQHPAVVYDYTPTRERADRKIFLASTKAICKWMPIRLTTSSSPSRCANLSKWAVLRTPEGTSIKRVKRIRHVWARCWPTSASCMRLRNVRARPASRLRTCGSCARKPRAPLQTSFMRTC